MKFKAISDICLVNPRMPQALTLEKDRTVDFIPMANVGEDGRVKFSSPRRLQEVRKGYTYFQNGDVIVAKITPCMENGKAAFVHDLPNEIGFGSTEFHVLRPNEGLDPSYLFHMVWSPFFRRDAVRNMTGTAGQQRVPASFFDQFKIPCPSLPEQRRIADILNKANLIRRKRLEVRAELTRLIDSQFMSVFGDPLTNPKKWVAGNFGDQLTLVQYGPRFFNEAYSTHGIRIVRITDLDQQGRLEFDAMPRMDVSDRDRESYLLKTGDLLLARSGATVGKTALINETAPECIAGAYFIRLRFKESIRPLYAQMVLRSKSVQTIIAQKSKQSAQQNFNGPAIRALPLPVPPTELQDEFVDFYEKAIETGRRQIQAYTEVDGLFNSLMHRAFRGDL